MIRMLSLRGLKMRAFAWVCRHIGAAAMVFGIVLAIKAAGIADLGGSEYDILSNGIKGLEILVIGLLLTKWKV